MVYNDRKLDTESSNQSCKQYSNIYCCSQNCLQGIKVTMNALESVFLKNYKWIATKSWKIINKIHICYKDIVNQYFYNIN